MILLVNGPNLNLLGEGGGETLADVERRVAEACAAYGVEVRAFQSNSEGALLDFVQRHRAEAQGVILNPGALAHTSHALHDLLRALPCPAIEVHLDNPAARPPSRRESVVAPAAAGQVLGLGTAGYHHAAVHLCALLAARAAAPEIGREPRPGASIAAPRASVGPAPPRGAASGDDIPPEGTPIPVDLNARGEYEPL